MTRTQTASSAPEAQGAESGRPRPRPVAAQLYSQVRRMTTRLCEPLVPEDYMLQSMPDASPVRWHIAHVTWFFETFVLLPHLSGYKVFHPQFSFLFNSYYNAVGPRWPRPQRGLLSRPTVAEIFAYRAYVDEQMEKLLDRDDLSSLITLGCNHEQQHQELIVTDLKHALGINPIDPVYRQQRPGPGEIAPHRWISRSEGIFWIGYDGKDFCFDNEQPRHRTFVENHQIASRLVSNREYLAFMNDGGYRRPELWLSEGWNTCQARGWAAPLYWDQRDGGWTMYSLAGRRSVEPDEPVCHISFYEADAFARWAGARLPTEAEWESAASESPLAGHFLDAGYYHPAPSAAAEDRGPLYQLHGDLWQWTASPYIAYPGYRPAAGALGEYNGKFMCNQFVLRGSSCATPRSHARHTYRNFFPADARWQFSGIRLAKEMA